MGVSIMNIHMLSVSIPVVLIMLSIAGCSGGRRPILYPNSQYELRGKVVADRDVNECIRRAREFGTESDSGSALARDTIGGAAIGGASAAAWGAVRGGDVWERAAAGAAAGGAAGLVRGALRSGEPSAVNENFVQRCLRDRGYDVIGWK